MADSIHPLDPPHRPPLVPLVLAVGLLRGQLAVAVATALTIVGLGLSAGDATDGRHLIPIGYLAVLAAAVLVHETRTWLDARRKQRNTTQPTSQPTSSSVTLTSLLTPKLVVKAVLAAPIVPLAFPGLNDSLSVNCGGLRQSTSSIA